MSGTYGGTYQIAAAAVVLEKDVVVVKMEVLNGLLEGKDLQKDLWRAMRYTHAQGQIAHRRPQSMLALLKLAKMSRRRPIFIVHGGANAAGHHFDCWKHPANQPPPRFVSTLLELWATGSFTVKCMKSQIAIQKTAKQKEEGKEGRKEENKDSDDSNSDSDDSDSGNDDGAAQMDLVDAEKASKAVAAKTARLASKASSAAAAAGAAAAVAALVL
eukprot:6208118-Pleurochrysis_carterae.AAC.3